MKKNLLLWILVMVSLSMTAQAETKEYSLSGVLDFDFFWGRNLNTFDNDMVDTPALIESEVELELNVSLTDNVSALITLGAWGVKPTSQMDMGLAVDKAYIEIREMYWEPFTFRIGVQDVVYQQCDDGSLRCGRSFVTRMEGLPGANFIFEFDQVTLEVFWGKFMDNTGAAVPMLTGSTADADVYSIFFQYSFTEENKLQAQLHYLHDKANMVTDLYGISPAVGNSGTSIFTLCVGLDWHFGDNWYVWGELAYTGGRLMAVVGAPDIDAAGFAGHVGLEYTWNAVDIKPYLGFELVYYQGDDATRTGTLVDAGFVPWTGEYRRSLIIERRSNMVAAARETEGWYDVIGMNNYWIVHLNGGLRSIWDGKIALDFGLHYASATDETLDNMRGNNIGWEFDVMAQYNYTEDLVFSLGLGYFVPHDDFAENRAAAAGATMFTNIDSDAAWVIIFNVTLNW